MNQVHRIDFRVGEWVCAYNLIYLFFIGMYAEKILRVRKPRAKWVLLPSSLILLACTLRAVYSALYDIIKSHDIIKFSASLFAVMSNGSKNFIHEPAILLPSIVIRSTHSMARRGLIPPSGECNGFSCDAMDTLTTNYVVWIGKQTHWLYTLHWTLSICCLAFAAVFVDISHWIPEFAK